MVVLIVLGVIVVLALLVGLWLMNTYNRLVNFREMVDNAMAQISAQVESRWDALSNLMGATKKYSTHESETFTKVIEARNKRSAPASVEGVEKDDQVFAQALNQLDVVVEQYPELKASGIYQSTMNSVNEYENNVRESRMVFNDTVTRYNRSIKMFPAVIIAGMLGFTAEEYFKSSESKQEMPVWD